MDNNFLKSDALTQGAAPMAGLRTRRSAHRWYSGFTLIELLATVAIIGILAAIAIPSYYSSVAKSNRSAAKSALLDLASREERYFSLNNCYSGTGGCSTASATDLFGAGTTLTFPIPAPLSGTAKYTIATPVVTAATGTTPATFTITATPVGSQATDACGSFIVNSVGQQTVTGTGSCW